MLKKVISMDLLWQWIDWLQRQVTETMDWAAPYINTFLNGSKKILLYFFANWQIVLAVMLIIGIVRTILSAIANPFGYGRMGGGLGSLFGLVGTLLLFALVYFLLTGQITPPPPPG